MLNYTEGGVIEKYGSTPKKPRYIMLTGSTSGTDLQITNLINTFNDPENARGDYINVILGTEKISEGITLFGIREFISFRGDHRRKFILQAEKRGVRLGAFLQLEPKERNININRLVVAYSDEEGNFLPDPTRDIIIYRQIEAKDFLIKKQKRLRKMYAIDCIPNYARNVQSTDKNYSNECDNEKCNYICSETIPDYVNKNNQVWKYEYPPEALNYTNYNILYSNEEKRKIISELQVLFQEKSFYNYNEIRTIFKDTNEVLLMQTLVEVIDNSIIMYTRYGTMAYLHEDNGIFFVGNNIDDSVYIENLYVENNKKLTELSNVIGFNDEDIVNEFCNASNDDERLKILQHLNGNLLKVFVEMFFQLSNEGKKYSNPDIINFFNKFIYKTSDNLLVHYLEYGDFDAETYGIHSTKLDANGKMRCLSSENNLWTYCNIIDEKKYIKEIKDKQVEERGKKFEDGANAYGKINPVGKISDFYLLLNVPMEVVCFSKSKQNFIKATGHLNLNFIDTGDIPNVESYKGSEYDDIQNKNISRMLNILSVSKYRVCQEISRQIRDKKQQSIEFVELSQKNLTKKEMIDMILDYDIVITDANNTSYPSLGDLRRLGYEGEELAPHTMRSLIFIYTAWIQKKEKTVQTLFQKSVKLYAATINTIYNTFNSVKTGRICHTLNKNELIRTFLELIPPETIYNYNIPREDMLEKLKKQNTGFFPEELDMFSDEQLNTIIHVFRTETKKSHICRLLYAKLDERNLIYKS